MNPILCCFVTVLLICFCVQLTTCCTCLPQHRQLTYCQVSFSVVGRVINVKRVKEDGAPSGPDPANNFHLYKHKVWVFRDFKGNATRRVAYVYGRGNSGLCGITLQTRKTYLINGYYEGEPPKIFISSCGWVTPWSDLTRHQRNSLRLRNDKNKRINRYSKGCKLCGIFNKHDNLESLDCGIKQQKSHYCYSNYATCTHWKNRCVWMGNRKLFRRCKNNLRG